MHGGLSTGPRTPEGLERCRLARWRHGRFSRQALDAAREAVPSGPSTAAEREAALRRFAREERKADEATRRALSRLRMLLD